MLTGITLSSENELTTLLQSDGFSIGMRNEKLHLHVTSQGKHL